MAGIAAVEDRAQHPAVDQAGAYAVHAHAGFGAFLRNTFGQPDHGVLAGAVDRDIGRADQAGDRRGVDDAALVLLEHHRQHMFHAEEDPYQLEIWWTIGMKDGDENAKTSLGWLLATGQGAFPNVYLVTAESCKRGRALLEEAKNDGDTAAMSMLKRVPYDCNIENQAPLTRG